LGTISNKNAEKERKVPRSIDKEKKERNSPLSRKWGGPCRAQRPPLTFLEGVELLRERASSHERLRDNNLKIGGRKKGRKKKRTEKISRNLAS